MWEAKTKQANHCYEKEKLKNSVQLRRGYKLFFKQPNTDLDCRINTIAVELDQDRWPA